jgi:hypothetical protein
MPKYNAIEKSAREKAARSVSAEPMGWKDTKAVLEIAQRELDLFWDSGSLISPEAYEHGYVARAILEMALEYHPDDFSLFHSLVEVINSTNPLLFADYQENTEVLNMVWPILERQRELVESGKVEPSPMAFDAMYDWALVAVKRSGKPEDSIPAWEWLLKNAQAGGWDAISDICKRGLQAAKDGIRYGGNIYVEIEVEGQADRTMNIEAKAGRRLMSLKGSKERREIIIPVWEAMTQYKGQVYTTGKDGKVEAR